MKISKNLFLILFAVVVFLFLKIDYRFVEEIVCCGDDHDYYMHTETIALDFDLDYSNQFENVNKIRYKDGNILAPKGFIGTGIFSSPFLFIGNLFSKLQVNTFMNYKIITYSFSSVFYFFLSFIFIIKTLKLIGLKPDSLTILLLFFGSGLPYFAFERYSMTHVYEVFTTTMVIYYSVKYYLSEEKNRKYFALLIPLWILFGSLVRWVNYFLFILPSLTNNFLLNNKSEARLLRDPYFYLGGLVSLILFLIQSVLVYGKIIFDPQKVYQNTDVVGQYLLSIDNIISFLSNNLFSLFTILFTKEFGIFWFSPIIFVGIVIGIYKFITILPKRGLNSLLIIIPFAQVFLVVVMWKSTASSYGFRYLFCLVPISIFLFEKFRNEKIIGNFKYYLIIFSIFSSLSILFFETTEETSLRSNINSFGMEERFSQPEYLTGYLESFTNFDSYLKIFVTSFLGVVIFKILTTFLGVSGLTTLLTDMGLPITNSDFELYLENITKVGFDKIIFTLFFVILLGNFVFNNINSKNKNVQ
jgi:hypothetical protein